MRKTFVDGVVSFFCLLLYAYFSWHYYYGSRNLAVLAQTENKALELRIGLQKEIDLRRRLKQRLHCFVPSI